MSIVKSSTNPIGHGTENVTVNFLSAEKRIYGQLALRDDRSTSEFIRRMALMGLRTFNPQAAQMVDEARQKHYDQMILKL
jgi:hypothetical protein